MKVLNLSEGSNMYTCNAYLITGNWNTIGDINTIIDVGRDPIIMDKIMNASTGVGKKRVECVILTHNHYDHVSMLSEIKKVFDPVVYAHSTVLAGVDRVVKDGEQLKVADVTFQVIYTPGHSNDSICLYCPEEKALFAGDTPVIISQKDSSYDEKFIEAIHKLSKFDIRVIYFGHGKPKVEGCNEAIKRTLSILS